MSDSVTPAVKEVRLGLVCYGGVSLAIYMHGLTKELFKLIRAARAFDSAYEVSDLEPSHWFTGAPELQGAPNYDGEPAYFQALAALAPDHPLTVVLDVIAGTSADGINGVCLARALAEGRSLNGFKKLWVEEGDMEVLLAGHALFSWGRGKMLSKLAESAGRLWTHPEAGLAADSHGTLKPDSSAKLDGVSIGHFGAFFDQSWRENDYLWGRLDGAELAIRLLSRQSGSGLDLTPYLRSALTAILMSGKADLALVAKVWQALDAQVSDIQPGALRDAP